MQDSTCTAGNTRTPVLITVNTIPAGAKPITGATTVCAGQNSVSYTVPVITKATSYSWTMTKGATGTSKANSITINFVISIISGNISVKGHNYCGVGSSSSFAISELNIKFAGNIERSDFVFLNITGQVVYKGFMYEKADIQMSDFLPGIYLIKVKF